MSNPKAEVVITYCTQCQWLLRAAWLAQELLSSFSDDLARVSLEPASGGTLMGKLRQVYADTRATLAKDEDATYVAQLEEAEDRILHAFEDAL